MPLRIESSSTAADDASARAARYESAAGFPTNLSSFRRCAAPHLERADVVRDPSGWRKVGWTPWPRSARYGIPAAEGCSTCPARLPSFVSWRKIGKLANVTRAASSTDVSMSDS